MGIDFVFPSAKGTPPAQRISVPFFHDGEELYFGLVEVGCSPGKKRKQLMDGRSMLQKVWEVQQKGIPRIYRFMVHYRPECDSIPDNVEHRPDVVVVYRHIDNYTLQSLTETERSTILRRAPNLRTRKELEEILVNCEADKLHALIVDRSRDNAMVDVRGILGEVVALKDIADLHPQNMRMLKNGAIIALKNGRAWSKEVDAILMDHGVKPYIELTAALDASPYLEVRQRLY